ncbi:viral A-type inclusion protein [Fibrella forsythiae]|uniref:Viral A-type inclusion protein n=1 Tax=Fibrella forsythiae TaxID=2817061 RepID=A0ABS3JGH0_9BACT|nr:viral A-type inclusion protein [Fibrella forsythiae]MBO0949095.1 viral A-type inclusion protein [Fibrella forsythiae]
MKNVFIAIGLVLALTACGAKEKTGHEGHDMAMAEDGTPIDKAEKEVLAVHDEVMPRIDNVMKLKKELNGKLTALDSIQGTPTETVRIDEQKAQLRQLVRHLTEADSLMMDWMGQYHGDTLKKLPEADALRYLAEQKQLINNAKAKINQSIQQAQTYLKQ